MHISHRHEHLPRQLSDIQSGVMSALVYFDLFRYPLTVPEIIRFSPVRIDRLEQVEEALRELGSALIVFRFGDHYSLVNDIARVERRKLGNACAEKFWMKARRMSVLMQRFPYVRSVNISGSLSKEYADDTTDIDYFIITAPGRIWLCRTLLALYKKVFLLNSRKYFCINYFISEDDLSIPDKNLFSATEIVTLRNMSGQSIYARFLEENRWAFSHFPNASAADGMPVHTRGRRMQKAAEKILAGRFGNLLDDLCFRITFYYWKRKFSWMREEEFAVNIRSKRTVSKHHPQGFQFQVMERFAQRCAALEAQHGIVFIHG